MSFDPSVIISLIENCFKVYNYAADVKHSSKERRQLRDEVGSLRFQLEALKNLTETSGIAGDEASMGQLAKLLDPEKPFAQAVKATLDAVGVALGCRASDVKPNKLKVLWRRLVAALWWTVNKEEAKELLSDLERYKSQIRLALEHDIFKKQDVMDGKLDIVDDKLNVVDAKQDAMDGKLIVMDGKQDAVAKQLSDETRLKIAQFISPNDYCGRRVNLSEQRLAGTGTWMLQHPQFAAWRDEEQSPTTLWCYGHPGAGKSVMAALIVDHLQSTPGNIVLSVFCRYSSDDFTTPFAVLRGLLRQLIVQSTMIPSTMYQQYQKEIPLTPDALPVFLAEMAASHTRSIYIVIDALDECKIALDLLRAIQQLGPSFRVLVTSRPVFNEIKEYPSIQIRASDHDILIAVDTTLPKLKGAWVDDVLKAAIRAKIVEKADGMFLLASLQLRELERDVTCQRDIISILDSLPRTLDDAYKLTFQRIRELGERMQKLVCRTLAIITLKSVDLGIEMLQYVLAEGDTTQYTPIETILWCCHGLVQRIPDFDFEFIHYSVYEYITTYWSELFPENPNRKTVCLNLGYSVLISPPSDYRFNHPFWDHVVVEMADLEDSLKQVISLLSTAAARASLVEFDPELACFVHDPLLIACHRGYWNVMEYMLRTAPADVQRFNEALRACADSPWGPMMPNCIKYINARPDMRVNRHGVVVAMDQDGAEGISSDAEDDEIYAVQGRSSDSKDEDSGGKDEDSGGKDEDSMGGDEDREGEDEDSGGEDEDSGPGEGSVSFWRPVFAFKSHDTTVIGYE